MIVDSHCHLDMLKLDEHGGDLSAVIKSARGNQVNYLLCVCVNLQDFPKVLSIAKTYEHVFCSVGVHPNNTGDKVTAEDIIQLANDEKVVAIGETGLDYFRSETDTEKASQQHNFREQIKAAKAVDKPLIIHTRMAREDTLKLMQEDNAASVGGVMHCFTESWGMAEAAMAMNFYISISGIVTFKNAKAVQEVAKKMPLDRLLIETDSPYLTPEPHRGKQNEPAYVKHVAEYIAQLKGISYEELAKRTTENFFNCFSGAQA